MNAPLTLRQSSLLESIRTFMSTQKRPPTIREVAKMNGITSTNGVRCHLLALERKGFLTITPGVSRGITIHPPQTQEPEYSI